MGKIQLRKRENPRKWREDGEVTVQMSENDILLTFTENIPIKHMSGNNLRTEF